MDHRRRSGAHPAGEGSGHPRLAGAVLMIGVVVFLILVSVLTAMG